MRNLKKVLSLSLALVMLLGMMVVGAGAAAFDDVADGADKQEAIEVMNAIEIIKGDGSGDFRPNDTLTRAEAAVIISKVLLTPAVVDRLVGVDSRFTDVADYQGGWAVPYVEACAQQQIIIGNGDGTFGPDNKVTAIQFAKMLLVTLEFDPARYSNPSTWELTARQDALKAGLDKNGVALVGDLTRENAAQMAFNAITEYSPSGASGYVVDGLGGTFDTWFEAFVAAGGLSNAANASKVHSAKGDTLAATRFGLSDKNITDDFGRTVKSWNVEGQNEPVYVSSKSTETPAFVFTSGKDVTAIKKELNGYSVPYGADGTTTTTPVNSADTVDLSTARAQIVVADGATAAALGTSGENAATKIAGLTHDGVIVEIYATNKVITKIITITKTVRTISGDVATRTVNDVEQVSVPGVTSGYKDVANVSGWENLAKGDVVLYVTTGTGADTKYHIELAEAVSGVVAGINTTKGLLMDGVYYNASSLTGATFKAANVTGWTDFKSEYTFYLDNGGFVVVAKTGEQAAAETNYAVVLQTAWVEGTGEIGNSKYAQAELLLTDGTKQVVTVSKVGSTALNAANGEATIGTVTAGDIYKYSVDGKGAYQLTRVEPNANATAGANGLKTETGKAEMGYGSSQSTKVPVNANTIFLVATSMGPITKYDAYVGNASVPNLEQAAAKIVLNSAGVAELVYITSAQDASIVVSEYVYFPAETGGAISWTAIPNTNGQGTAYYEAEAIVDGVLTTVKVKDPDDLVGHSTAIINTMYTVSEKDGQGVVSTMTAATPTGTGVTVSGGTLVTGGKGFTVNDDTRVVYISDDNVANEIAVADIVNDTTDIIYVVPVTGQATVAATVYIKQVVADSTAINTTNSKIVVAGSDDAATISGSNGAYTATVSSVSVGNTIGLKLIPPAGATVTNVRTVSDANTTVHGTLNKSTYQITGEDVDGNKLKFEFTVIAENGDSEDCTLTITFTAVTHGLTAVAVKVNGSDVTLGANSDDDILTDTITGNLTVGQKITLVPTVATGARATVKVKSIDGATTGNDDIGTSSYTVVKAHATKVVVFEISVTVGDETPAAAYKVNYSLTLPADANITAGS